MQNNWMLFVTCVGVACLALFSSAGAQSSPTTTTTTTTTAATTTTTTTTPSVVVPQTTTTPTNSSTATPTRTTTPAPPTVNIPGLGSIRGLRRQLLTFGSSDAFLGIPFAKPPVGDLRFQAPVAFDGTFKNFDATRLPPACYQPTPTTGQYVLNTVVSEDCLYLNVWRPTVASSTPRAVMVWIYGGGFYSGSASLPLYDGSLLSLKGDVIVVSMQYRVGPLGFLSLDDEHIPGNYGLLDQQMALQWVQNHIAAFGGDASYVTLFGESAGGASVSFHLLSPGSEQLFRNAIMESTTANAPSIFFSKDEAQTNAFALAKLVNCSSTRRTTIKNVADCLRQKTTASALTTEQFKIPFSGPSFRPRFGPTVDGTFLTKSPMELLNAGHFQQKNILLGVNSDEAGFFVLSAFPDYFSTSDGSAPELTPAKYRTAISAMIPLNTSQISAVAFEYSTPCQFADRQSLSNFQALVDLVGDREFKCPVVEVALAYAQESLDSGNDFSVYVYTFEHRDPLDPWPQWAGRALHGDEISFVFGQPFNWVTSANYTDSERQLSDKIITFWANFAKSGDPNKNNNTGSVTPDNWPKYTADERLVMTFDIGNLQTQAGLRDRQCDFWNVLIPELSATTGHGVRLAGTQSLITTFVMVVCVSLRLISV